MDTTPLIDSKTTFELRKVSKVYQVGASQVQALKDINLKFASGDFLSITGPSGSGKTTLLNILGCLDVPTHGEVIIDDQIILPKLSRDKIKIRRKKIGFIFQRFNLIPVLTVFENVEYPLILLKNKRKIRKSLVKKALADVGLSNKSKHFPNQLSGGECQRASIARALVKMPRLVLADEPTANLDSQTGMRIIELMKKLNQEEKITFIFSTHDSQLLSSVNKVVVLHDGTIRNHV